MALLNHPEEVVLSPSPFPPRATPPGHSYPWQILFVHWTTGRSSGHLWWNVCLDPFLLVLKKFPPFIWEVVDASTTLSSVHLKNFYSVACIFAGKNHIPQLASWKSPTRDSAGTKSHPGTPKTLVLQCSNFEGSQLPPGKVPELKFGGFWGLMKFQESEKNPEIWYR